MMIGCLLAALLTLRPHFDLDKTRLETLSFVLVGLATGRIVKLSHLASQVPGDALHASNCRLLQRFFQHERLDGDIAARLIVRRLNLARPKLRALDRTNWQLGAADMNVPVLAMAARKFRVPPIWALLRAPIVFREAKERWGPAGRPGAHRIRVDRIPD